MTKPRLIKRVINNVEVFPVTLYFGTAKDRDEFIKLIKTITPDLPVTRGE